MKIKIHTSKNAEFAYLLFESTDPVQKKLPVNTRWNTNKKFSSTIPAPRNLESNTSHLVEIKFNLRIGDFFFNFRSTLS